MQRAAPGIDHGWAELAEQIARVHYLADGCSLVLDRVVSQGEFARAVLLLQTELGLRGASWGITDSAYKSLTDPTTDAGAVTTALLQKPGVRNVPREHLPEIAFKNITAVTFTGIQNSVAGVLLLDAAVEDAHVAECLEILARVGPSLHRSAFIADLEAGLTKRTRQHDMLNAIVNALADPVLLTDTRNDIVLANQRAESVLIAGEQSSEGRRRAIEVNNLLFSSFLTQTLISTSGARARELNLVDPSDGSDLLFEVIVLPIETSPNEPGVVSILRDITDLKRALTELEVQFNRSRVAEHRSRSERDRLNVMLENVSDPILVTDEASNIILMNPEADRLFVLPPDADPEAPYSRMVQANDTKFTSLISDFLLQTQRRRVERIDLIDPDTGRLLPAEVHSSKIVNARGETTAMVSVLHDLTQFVENQRLAQELRLFNEQLEDRISQATLELEERNRQLEWQSSELEKASRLKSEFLAAMSHELRTPLNVIIGYSSLMRERIYGELSEAQDETLQKVYSTSQHLLALINDVLDLSKIEAGKMPLHLEEVDLGAIIAELSETVMPMVRKKNLDYSTKVADKVPHIITDRTKLKQILLNLLSNAIKFTAKGTVVVDARLTRSKKRVQITVTDTGIGIKPEYVEVIFEDFRQLDQSHTREYGGTGLGLSITKNLLALLGGMISVESNFGEGSTFVVELPLQTVIVDAVPKDADSVIVTN
ncbi:MAG TPA: ATP-binding protein [Longimicrobiales bacterium]|nr:ATP-binding protein [Longimicrobiales bacterium]